MNPLSLKDTILASIQTWGFQEKARFFHSAHKNGKLDILTPCHLGPIIKEIALKTLSHPKCVNNELQAILSMCYLETGGVVENILFPSKELTPRSFEPLCRSLSTKRFSNLKGLDLTNCQIFTNKPPFLFDLTNFRLFANKPSLLFDLRNIECLILSGSNVSDYQLRKLPQLSQLQSLDLSNCKEITSKGLAQISKLPKLSSLDISSSKGIETFDLSWVPTKITRLYLDNIHYLTKEGVKPLKIKNKRLLPQLTNLIEFYHSDDPKFKDVDLAWMAAIPLPLKALHLNRCFSLTGEGLSEISKFTKLRYLDIFEQTVTPSVLIEVGKLSHLQFLALTFGTKFTPDNKCRSLALNPNDFKPLANLTSLKQLTLSTKSPSINSGLSSITNLKCLQKLELLKCRKINNMAFSHISKCTNLQTLTVTSLRHANLKAIKKVNKLTNLIRLKLLDVRTPEKDNIVGSIAHLTNLKSVTIKPYKKPH